MRKGVDDNTMILAESVKESTVSVSMCWSIHS